jgi:sulfur carrier protein
MNAFMNVTVNGQTHGLEGPLTLVELLARLEMAQRSGIAVLLNGEVARRSEWQSIRLQAGDELEIVRATVGG